MSGISELQPGAEVPLILMSEGTQYQKGDIIVFYRDDIKIIHLVEFVYTSNGETFYVTEGVNKDTNPYVDDSSVAGDDIIGIVDLSEEVYLALEEMLENKYVPVIQAFGMTQNFQEFIKFLNEKNKYINRAFYAVTKLAHDKNLKLISPENHNIELDKKEYIQAVIEAYERGKFPGDAILTWKHEDCGTIWENSYNNFQRNLGTCPKCTGRYINQKITCVIADYIFKSYTEQNRGFQVDIKLSKMFDINLLEYYGLERAHVDMYAKLIFEDKIIKLAIEYDGIQHEKDPNVGFEALLAMIGKADLDKNSREYQKLRQNWDDYIQSDEGKDELFSEEDEFYLIRVPYTKKPNERQDYLIKIFEELTKIKLPSIEIIDPKLLI